jgi:hypothetical protein
LKPKYTIIYYESSDYSSGEDEDQFNEEPVDVFKDARKSKKLGEHTISRLKSQSSSIAEGTIKKILRGSEVKKLKRT